VSGPFSASASILGLPTSPPLPPQIKEKMRRLVDQGASLRGVNTLRTVAANYKQRDLLDFLLDDLNMAVDQFDENDHFVLHVAVSCSNVFGVKVLLEHGTDPKSQNRDGDAPLQVLQTIQESMANFQRVMGKDVPFGQGAQDTSQIKRLLSSKS
jgi:hypothetical protein